MIRANEDDVTQPTVHELDTSKHECTHDDVAQLGIGLDELQEARALDEIRLAIRPRGDARERRASRKEAHLIAAALASVLWEQKPLRGRAQTATRTTNRALPVVLSGRRDRP